MPATAPGTTVIVTKNTGTGNFQFLVQSPNGGVRMAFVLLSADMATAAALGSGASSTFTYGQDGSPTGPTHVDFPDSYAMETF
jgi:hypothetical protein